MDKKEDVYCNGGVKTPVPKGLIKLFTGLKKKDKRYTAEGIEDYTMERIVELYKAIGPNFNPFAVQTKGNKIVHSNIHKLFKPAEVKAFDNLWNSDGFLEVFKAMETLKWDNLMHGLAIYYSCKLRNIDKEFIMKNFDMKEIDYDSIEMKVIDKLVTQNENRD